MLTPTCFHTLVNKTKFEEKIGLDYRGDGWYQKGKDWMLVQSILGAIQVSIWVDHDPRKEFFAAASYAVITDRDWAENRKKEWRRLVTALSVMTHEEVMQFVVWCHNFNHVPQRDLFPDWHEAMKGMKSAVGDFEEGAERR